VGGPVRVLKNISEDREKVAPAAPLIDVNGCGG
jgi:hypothetical protein